jgi:hypothetical protein
MTRLAIAMTLLVCGCFEHHPAGQQELMGTDCYSCHATDYTATTAPVHRDTPQIFSTSCAGCHRTAGWQPALAGLHSDTFIITSGAHAKITCLGCHDLSSGQSSHLGANTNCLQCHPDDAAQRDGHAGVTTVASTPYAYLAAVPNFCLQCHPAGIADVHPDKLFARTDNHAVPCEQCHDRAAGSDTKGANVTCVDARCHHTLSDVEGDEGHTGQAWLNELGDRTSRNFCHHCHS